MHSFRKSQLTVDPELDWVGGLPESTFERGHLRLACYTPVGIHSKNSSQTISGSCFLAIASEFKRAALYFQMDKPDNIFAQTMPLLPQIHHFLEIGLKEKNAAAQGLLESKMRLLRECLEARLPIAIYDRLFRRQELELLDSTGGQGLSFLQGEISEYDLQCERAEFGNSVSPVLMFMEGDVILVSLPLPLRLLPPDHATLMALVTSKVEHYMQQFINDILRLEGQVDWKIVQKQ